MSNPFITAWRAATSRPRLLAGLLFGLLISAVIPTHFGPVTKAIAAWDAGVILYLILALFLFATETVDRIASDAAAQREGEWTIFWLTLGAALASFAAIFTEFSAMKDLPSDQKAIGVALVVVTLLASWLMTHVTFTFRYAHEYYASGREAPGGLSFPGETHPDFLDFLYFSLGLGTTFQVSDVQITARRIRHLATVQGLMSFLFNTVILALTVNLASGLL